MQEENKVDVGDTDEQATEIDLDAPAPEQSLEEEIQVEQIRTFAWVKSEDKYLFVMEGQAHFLNPPEQNDQINNLINLLVDFKNVDDNLFTTYNNTKSIAFLKFHIAENNDYELYLYPSYWQQISDENYPIYWLDKSAVNELVNTYNRFKPAAIPTLSPN